MNGNTRIWVSHRGDFVRLHLEPGSEFDFCEFERDEEGWSFKEHVVSYDGENIIMSYFTKGQDCDGITTSGGAVSCSQQDAQAGASISQDVRLPAWKDIDDSSFQRDFAAEAAGY
jgi:hypothetical protein